MIFLERVIGNYAIIGDFVAGKGINYYGVRFSEQPIQVSNVLPADLERFGNLTVTRIFDVALVAEPHTDKKALAALLIPLGVADGSYRELVAHCACCRKENSAIIATVAVGELEPFEALFCSEACKVKYIDYVAENFLCQYDSQACNGCGGCSDDDEY